MRPSPTVAVAAAVLLAGAQPARAEPDAGLLQRLTGQAAADAGAHLRGLREAFDQAPSEALHIASAAAATLDSGTGVRSVTYALILVVVGCGLEWLYWTFAAAPLRGVAMATQRTSREAAAAAGRRLAFFGSGLLLFAASTLGAAVALPWPRSADSLAFAATALVVAVRAAWMLADAATTSLQAVRCRAGLAPVRRAPAVAAVVWLAALAASSVLVPGLVATVGGAPHLAAVIQTAIGALIAASVLVASCIALRTPHGPGPAGWRRPRFPMSFVAAAVNVAVFSAWVAGAGRLAALLVDAAAAGALLAASGRLVPAIWREMAEPVTTGAPATAAGIGPLVALSAARFAILAVGAGAAAATAGLPLASLGSAGDPLGQLALRVAGVAVAAFAAHLAWVALRFSIDRRLADLAPLDPHGAADPNARLLTLLPLLRTTLGIAFALLFGLSALWALGIQITPLLAGAGVFGLAVGFGAQALVRDVISGVFFLVEDVFRIGEYIESGASTRGTVERITLRTVALRHHNGPLHFVPYGSLGTVRNNSRDWVVDKFNLPLPVHVDSEQIRKLVKRVGEAMAEDPELGPLIREPLKGKLYRIDPGVKVFRCKFMTMPGRQFEIRSAALRMIEAALGRAGIAFADAGQTIVIRGPLEDA